MTRVIVSLEQLQTLVGGMPVNTQVAGDDIAPTSGATDAREYLQNVSDQLGLTNLREVDKPEYEVAFSCDCYFKGSHKNKSMIGKVKDGGYF